MGSAPSRSQPGASNCSPSPRLENEQKPPPCVSVAPTGQTTFVACAYLAMTVLALGCAYAHEGLRRGAGIVIICVYLAFVGVLLASAY